MTVKVPQSKNLISLRCKTTSILAFDVGKTMLLTEEYAEQPAIISNNNPNAINAKLLIAYLLLDNDEER